MSDVFDKSENSANAELNKFVFIIINQYPKFKRETKNTIFPKGIGSNLSESEKMVYFIQSLPKKQFYEKMAKQLTIIKNLRKKIKILRQKEKDLKERHKEEIVKALLFGKDYKRYLTKSKEVV